MVPANNQNQANRQNGRRPEKENPHRINDEITAPQVRVVGDNVEPNLVLPIREAIRLADEMELDLIEISPKAEPPVCRIADYQKFLYQQKKKAKEIKAKQTKARRPTITTTTSNSSTRRTSSKRVRKLRRMYFSEVARLSSKSRERFSCCVLQPTWKRSPRWRLCLHLRVRR